VIGNGLGLLRGVNMYVLSCVCLVPFTMGQIKKMYNL
jgi:hypothetical protein